MKKLFSLAFCVLCTLILASPLGKWVQADTGSEFVAIPPFVDAGAPPLVMLALGRDHKLYYEAYNDASDLDEDGILDVRYKPSIDYYGYFDSKKCYEYDTRANLFLPRSRTEDKKCVGEADDKWSGNFLNYITMTRIDAIRKVLYGGYRVVDTASETVLQRALVPQDAHSWGKEYTSAAVDGYDIADYTPFTQPSSGRRHLFANTTAGGYDQPPLLRYALNNRHRIWTWVSRAAPQVVPAAIQELTNNPRPAFPTNHAQYEALVLAHATHNRYQGAMSWQDYKDRNKLWQLFPSPSASNFGAIDGAGNPFSTGTYGPTDTYPSSTYQPNNSGQNDFLLIFTGILHVNRGGSYSFGVDGDDSVEVIINGGTAQEHIVGYYGGHGRAGAPMCQNASGAGGACSNAGNVQTIILPAGRHRVEFRLMEASTDDRYHLYWRGPDSGGNWAIIPNSKFTDLSISGYNLVTTRSEVVEHHVKVKVCDPAVGLEENCHQYPNKNYKPRGILQRRGEKDQMFFGLMTGSYAKNASGGVLRKRVSSMKDEIDADTGVFKDTAIGTGSIIRTIDNLRVYGYTYAIEKLMPNQKQPANANHYGADRCGWITSPLYSDNNFLSGQVIGSSSGRCSDWGNPIAEIMYESVRYFAGKAKPTPEFDYGDNANIKDIQLGLPKATWNDPYDMNKGGFDYCSKPFLLVLSDINPSYDTDQLPGVVFAGSSAFKTDLSPAMHVGNLAKTISDAEGLTGKKYIGQSGADANDPLVYDGYCSAKDMTSWGLGTFRGLCPEEPTKRGGYYAASVAYYGKINDLNPAKGEQKLTTYAVALASPLPEIKVQIGPQKKLITLVPFGKTVGTLAGTGSTLWSQYAPTNTIVDFYVEEISPVYGKFQINFEDVEQGADHDMDALVTYEYWLVDNNDNAVTRPEQATRLRVKLTSTEAAGSYIQHLGYIISGTTADGPYLEVRDKDTSDALDVISAYDTPPGHNSPPGVNSGIKLPQQTTRWFTPGTGTGTASLLKDPLWYAGKWGGFVDKEPVNNIADTTDEWDRDLDGVPDNYFFVVNPLRLEEQLNKAFNEILNQASSGTAASVVSNSGSGEGAVYQAVFFPALEGFAGEKITWAGEVRGLFMDTYGNLREDTNKNGRLDVVGPDLDGNKRVVHEDVNMNCQLDDQDSISEDANRNDRLDTEYGNACVPYSSPKDDPFLSKLDAIVVFEKGTIKRYYDVNGNGILEPQEKKYNRAPEVTDAQNISYLWNSSDWLNSISDTDIVQQRSSYISSEGKRHIFTWVDGGTRNGLVDAGEVQDFVWKSGAAIEDISNPNRLYSYLNLYPSFGNRPLPINNLTDTAALFEEFLLKQTARQVNWMRGLDELDTKGIPTPVTLSTGRQVEGTELRSRRLNKQTWRLGDVVYSTPTTVSAPAEAFHLLYKDRTFEDFYMKYRNRRSVVYVGANDGMLHAFNAGFYSAREKQFCQKLNPNYNPYDANAGNDDPCANGSGTPELGAELWAYVPYNLLPHLFWLTEKNYEHIYYVDGKPRVFDAKIFAPEGACSDVNSAGCVHPHGWGTIMVVGMRFGGAGITADLDKRDGNAPVSTDPEMRSAFLIFDITNPEQPPTLLGEIAMPKMGFATNYPTMVIMKDGDGDKRFEDYNFTDPAAGENLWLLAFGSGPADAAGVPHKTLLNTGESYQNGNFYLLDLIQLVQQKKLMSLNSFGNLADGLHPYFTLPAGEEQSFIGDPVTVDLDLDFNADVVYFGTVSGSPPLTATNSGWKGKMRRIVIDDKQAPTDWVANSILYDAQQPITTGATLGLDTKKRPWVFFGTGRFFATPDKLDTSTQSYYGIKEPLTARTGGGTSRTKQLAYTQVDANSLVNVTNYRVFGGKTRKVDMNGEDGTWEKLISRIGGAEGWRIDFLDPTDTTNGTNRTIQKGERNLGQAALLGGVLTFTTFTPPSDICLPGGKSALWARYFETGTDYFKPIFLFRQREVIYLGKKTPLNDSVVDLGAGFSPTPSLQVGENDGSTAFIQVNGQVEKFQQDTPFSTKSGKNYWKLWQDESNP